MNLNLILNCFLRFPWFHESRKELDPLGVFILQTLESNGKLVNLNIFKKIKNPNQPYPYVLKEAIGLKEMTSKKTKVQFHIKPKPLMYIEVHSTAGEHVCTVCDIISFDELWHRHNNGQWLLSIHSALIRYYAREHIWKVANGRRVQNLWFSAENWQKWSLTSMRMGADHKYPP